MAERSFKSEIEQLRAGNGEEFYGEGILAVTKALLQSGVAYIGGYQGAPISHLLDVFSDAEGFLRELGVHFEASASEASAAAMLAASVNYPMRGAVAWKSVVGTNVASDALSNLSSGGVTGGALIVVGEDYGEGSSIVQERTHAFAMKSQIWLLDPRPNLPSIVTMVEKGFELSEASRTPVMLALRIRACHVTGTFIAKDNVRPPMTTADAAAHATRDLSRICLPPASFAHEIEKVQLRKPAAIEFVEKQKLNEYFGPAGGDIGIIVQGGLFNAFNRAAELVGLSDLSGNVKLPTYCLNVAYPVIPNEVKAFCVGKKAVFLIEEGSPEFLEFEINSLLKNADISTTIIGKDVLPSVGEYTVEVIKAGLEAFLEKWAGRAPAAEKAPVMSFPDVQPRPPGFCTGCPERPIFTAMKLLEREVGPIHVAADVGCHLFSILPPFNIGNTTMGYGLGGASASAFSDGPKRTIAMMGDGGFWHNGLTSGVGNAVYNQNNGVTLIVQNGYAAATGGQDVLSSPGGTRQGPMRTSIEEAVRSVGVKWVKTLTRTYDVPGMLNTLRQAFLSPEKGPKVVIADSECMLNKQRRVRPLLAKKVAEGERVVREKFGVDSDTCTGDHSCIRLSGCPSLTIKPNPDPLRTDPIAHVENSCVGCGLCGEVAHAAVLCPSFYRAGVIQNPSWWDRFLFRLRRAVIQTLQSWSEPGRDERSYEW